MFTFGPQVTLLFIFCDSFNMSFPVLLTFRMFKGVLANFSGSMYIVLVRIRDSCEKVNSYFTPTNPGVDFQR